MTASYESPVVCSLAVTDDDGNNTCGAITVYLCEKTVTDIEGHVYRTVFIGPQVWMAENLKTTTSNNGTPIKRHGGAMFISHSDDYPRPAIWYQDSTYKEIYGVKYSGYTIDSIAPIGWRIPALRDFEELLSFISYKDDYMSGNKLRERGTTHWPPPNEDATDEFGFTALPSDTGGGSASFWTKEAWFFFIYAVPNNGSNLGMLGGGKELFHHVRCLLDTSLFEK